MTDESMVRLREAEKLLGVKIVDASVEAALGGDDIASVLVPGAHVCSAARRRMPRGESCHVTR